MRLVYARDNDLTYNSIRFDWYKVTELWKAFRHFLTAIKYKKKNVPKTDLFTVLAVKTKVSLSDFLASSSSWKIANTGKPA